MEQFREELLGAIQEVGDNMLLALNEAVDRNNKANEGNASLLTTLQADIESLREELSVVRAEASRLKVRIDALGSGSIVGTTTTRLELPKPDTYNGSRKLKDIENFLYVMERYFTAAGLTDDSVRIFQASIYLRDSALSW